MSIESIGYTFTSFPDFSEHGIKKNMKHFFSKKKNDRWKKCVWKKNGRKKNWTSQIFGHLRKFPRLKFFCSVEKYFWKNFVQTFFFVFVNNVNIAFQQAIELHLTPPGRWERAICIPKPRNLGFGDPSSPSEFWWRGEISLSDHLEKPWILTVFDLVGALRGRIRCSNYLET